MTDRKWTEEEFIARCRTIYKMGNARPDLFALMQRWLDAVMRYEHTMFSYGQSQGRSWLDFLDVERERVAPSRTLATDRKPALKQHQFWGVQEMDGPFEIREWVLASDLPPAILNATKEELAALAVFAEAMPELLEEWPNYRSPTGSLLLSDAMDAALAAAKGVEG